MKPPPIKRVEMAVVEDVLAMSGGYVLKFSDRTFAEFMSDYAVEIDDQKYGGGSKASRLRGFLQSEPAALVAEVLAGLRDVRTASPSDDASEKLEAYNSLVARLRGPAPASPLPSLRANDIGMEYVRQLEKKVAARMLHADHEGAITAARTLLEEVLGALEEALTSRREDYKGDLPKQYKVVAKRLRIDDERTDLDDRFKDVVRGLVQVVNGFASLSNSVSDRHARKKAPAAHHARAVTDAARVVATLLVESYLFQTAQKKPPAAP